MKKNNYLDISGVGNAGKSAVVDLLREYDEEIWAPHFQFEFDLLRVPGGVFDLKYSIVDNWSQIRSNYAIGRFLKVSKKMGGSGRKKNLYDLAINYGTSYEIYFKGRFHKITKEYLDSLIVNQYKAFWPYDMLDDHFVMRFFKKFCIKFKLQKFLLTNVVLVDHENFCELTHGYIDSLFNEAVVNPRPKRIILNNSFEPFNPCYGLDIFKGSQSIIVVRDPRDIYVSGMNVFNMKQSDKNLMAKDNDGVNKSFLGAGDVKTFVDRMNLYLDKLYIDDERILVIRFEDLVLKYNETKKLIEKFLNLSSEDHTSPFSHFNPESSKQGVGAWKNYSNQEELDLIKNSMNRHSWVFQE